ncbi:MAG: hypothetical protein RSA99_00865, partial [Oscillospiraceae bacterium]
MIPGGWEILGEISQEHLNIFERVKPMLKNGVFTPMVAALQSFGGTNICFISKCVRADSRECFVKVLIHLSVGGSPELTSSK